MIPHFLSIKEVSFDTIMQLIAQAQSLIDSQNSELELALKNKTVANLFFEMSTRTRSSFELAAKRLGADVLNFDTKLSSLGKGETLLDTVSNLEAMGVDAFIIRHKEEGIPEFVAKHSKRASIINAGDGCHEHPTQAMLDALTIYQQRRNFDQLSIAIVGDILHSRVAHSALHAFLTLKVPDIRLVGPKTLLPEMIKLPGVSLHQDLKNGISNADVIMVLRLQHERMQEKNMLSPQEYFSNYGLTTEKLNYAKPNAIVMHPGPINRGVEIESEVADGPQSVILQQVSNGVAMRMAIMKMLLKR
jgi:aspartate carbamoyltransferase catalytic subunit